MKTTKPRQYTKWTIEQKKNIINQYETSGEALVDICRNNGIYPAQFYTWVKQVKNKTAKYKVSPPKKKPAMEKHISTKLKRLDFLIKECQKTIEYMIAEEYGQIKAAFQHYTQTNKKKGSAS
jgi:transposase-like protein